MVWYVVSLCVTTLSRDALNSDVHYGDQCTKAYATEKIPPNIHKNEAPSLFPIKEVTMEGEVKMPAPIILLAINIAR